MVSMNTTVMTVLCIDDETRRVWKQMDTISQNVALNRTGLKHMKMFTLLRFQFSPFSK